MMFRTAVFLAASFLRNEDEKKMFCLISVISDIFLMERLVHNFYWKKTIVMRHQNPVIPLTIQALLLIPGIIAIL